MKADLKVSGMPTEMEPRHPMAELLDEVGSCARGEMPLPDRDRLANWLYLLNVVDGSDAAND